MKRIYNATLVKCVIAAFFVLAICSKCSFLYPMNNWGDANVYFTIGRGMLHGLVPFKDLAEQKGPVIFFAYALGGLISESSFIGIYFIEVICSMLFIYNSIRIVRLFQDTKGYEFLIASVAAIAVYSAYIFRHGGGPEELLLFTLSYMLFIGTRYLEKDIIPNTSEMIVLGICAGLIFWTKYTLCSFYIVILAFMLIHAIKRRELFLFSRSILMFIGGCVIITIPIIIYFAINNALIPLWTDYFYNNIFLYKSNGSMNWGFRANTSFAVKLLLKSRNVFAITLILAGAIWLYIKKKYNILIMYSVTFLMVFFVLNNGIVQKYGNIPLLVFIAFGFCPLVALLKRKEISINIFGNALIAVSCIIAAYFVCLNTCDIFKSKSDMPQYTFAEEINDTKNSDSKLLYYGPLDEGFYFAAGYTPKWRAFVQTNQGGGELKNLQDSYVKNAEPDYIVSGRILCDKKDYNEMIKKYNENDVIAFEDFDYDQIDEKSFYYEEYNNTVRLYKRK